MEATFLTPLRVEKIGQRRWLLTDDLVFHSAALRGRLVATRGFQTDFASIPRFAWVIFPPVDNYDAPAVIHDGAYGNALVTENGDRIYLIKTLGDNLFREAMLVCNVKGTRANVMWWIVKEFGNPQAHPLAAHRSVLNLVEGSIT